MGGNKNIDIFRCAVSITCMICWTFLAIAFNKPGLALFVLLSTPVRCYHRFCDKCGKHSPLAFTYNGAIEKAQADGWIIRKVGDKWDDRCPDCRREE